MLPWLTATPGRRSPSRGMEGSKATFLKPWREWQGVCATLSGQNQGSCKDLSPIQVPLALQETAAPTGFHQLLPCCGEKGPLQDWL